MNKLLKAITLIGIVVFIWLGSLSSTVALSKAAQKRQDDLREMMLVNNASNQDASWKDKTVADVFKTANNYLLSLYGIIAVGCFLFVWVKFVTALWKPEEAKKAWMAFMWVVLWLALVPLSYVLITIVAGLNLS